MAWDCETCGGSGMVVTDLSTGEVDPRGTPADSVSPMKLASPCSDCPPPDGELGLAYRVAALLVTRGERELTREEWLIWQECRRLIAAEEG